MGVFTGSKAGFKSLPAGDLSLSGKAFLCPKNGIPGQKAGRSTILPADLTG